ncbi:MAG: hypothetical protein J7516_17355 [Shinella sp.]|nr:hypothetical protein [Shinella sp.]
MDIKDYVKLPVSFGWGGVGCEDCTTWCATYARLLTGDDPASDFRGTYTTETGAKELIARHGGLVLLAGPRLERAGWKRVQNPENGDLAVIHAVAGFSDREPYMTEISAIRFGPLWSALGLAGPVGLAPGRVRHVASCWRPPV